MVRGTVSAPVSRVRMQRIECSGRTQRRVPSPQRMDFGQGKPRTVASTVSATISAAGRPGWSRTAKSTSPLGSGRDCELVAGQAGGAEEAVDRFLGGVGAGALALLAERGGAFGEAFDRQRQAAGRGEGGGVGVGEAALDQAVGDEAAQVVGGLPLHPGGDFLGEEFEEEVGHREGPLGAPMAKPEAVREVKGECGERLRGAWRSAEKWVLSRLRGAQRNVAQAAFHLIFTVLGRILRNILHAAVPRACGAGRSGFAFSGSPALRPQRVQRSRKPWVTSALAMSTKTAETSGSTMKAAWLGP